MNVKIFLVALVVLLAELLSVQSHSLAQEKSSSGYLVYIKQTEDGVSEILSLDIANQHKSSILIKSDEWCFELTNDAFVVYQGDKNELALYSIPDFLQKRSWIPQSILANCHIDARNGAFVIWSNESQVAYQFSAESDSLRGIRQSSVNRISSQLPFQAPFTTAFYDPQRRYAFYGQCDQLGMSDDGSRCLGKIEKIIYDINSQTIIATLPDAYEPLQDEAYIRFPHSLPGIFWSPSGRFLLYRTVTPTGVYRIFETQTRNTQSIKTLDSIGFSPLSEFTWSHDETQVAFWIPKSDLSTYSLGILDVTSHVVIIHPSPHELSSGYLLWSPNDAQVGFINSQRELVIQDAITGFTRVVDNNVNYLWAWIVK